MNTKRITPQQLVKRFFRQHPRVRIVYHHRREELKGADRESLDAVRAARKVGLTEIGFDHLYGYSVLGLKGITHATIDDDGNLGISMQGNGVVEIVYHPAGDA